jgi:hypothetical protein
MFLKGRQHPTAYGICSMIKYKLPYLCQSHHLAFEVFYLAPTEALNNVHNSEVLPQTSKLPAEEMPTEDKLSHILITYDWQP